MPEEQGGNRNELGQFIKGESGNPGGRPTGSIGLNRRIRELLLSEPGGKPIAQALVEVLVREAIKNPAKMWPFIKEVMERDEGVVERNQGPLVSIDLSGKVPQAPPLESGKNGAPSLGEHLALLTSIAKERGLCLPGEVAEAEITTNAEKDE